MEPLIKDHRTAFLDNVPKLSFPIFLDLQEEDNLSIVDEMAGPQCVLYSEVPLYIRKRTTSL